MIGGGIIKTINYLQPGKIRVLGLASGSANSLWKALELQQKMEREEGSCPFEIIGVFSDNPNAKCLQVAKELGISYRVIDIKVFYTERKAKMNDMEVRAEYDKAAIESFRDLKPELIMLSGYVWAITDVILTQYKTFGIHPGDLTVIQEGIRILAGANGIKSAFEHNMDHIRASSYLATSEIDGGPVFITSPAIPVDYSLHSDEEERFRYYLKLVNEQNRLVAAQTLLEITNGNFQIDKNSKCYYKGKLVPYGIKLESWEEKLPDYKFPQLKLVDPKSIVVLGASQKQGIGQSILKNIKEMGFKGDTYVVNVRGEDVLGVNGYKNVLDIEDEVDMAVIAVPSKFVVDVVEECGEKGIKAIVCITAGFKESGDEGAVQERKLVEIVEHYKMYMIGPNCMGIINTSDQTRLNATILSTIPRKGNIAMLTQSGALGAALLEFADELAIGFSIIVSTGNQAHMNVCDFLPLLEKDENTRVVMMYLENIPEPQRFREIVSKMSKPVVILKSGRTDEGAEVASSHTGSIAGNDKIANALIRQSGAIRVRTLGDAYQLSATLSKIDMLKGNRIGIVSNSGGMDILMADDLVQRGFTLPNLPQQFINKLRQQLMPEATIRNPIDLVATARPEQYNLAVQEMLRSGEYDGIVVICVPAATVETDDVASILVDTIKNANIPVMTCFFGHEVCKQAKLIMKEQNIPTFDFPENIADMLDYIRMQPPSIYSGIQPIFDNISRAEVINMVNESPDGIMLTVRECEKLMSAYGIPVVRSGYINTIDEIGDLSLTYPVVAKIDHPDIIHKSDSGGVQLNIKNETELDFLVNRWYEKFKGLNGINIQEQVFGDFELIIGCAYDSSLGHAILVGVGGTLVELIEDVSFGHVPITGGDAAQMLKNLKCYSLIEGHRGKDGVDIGKLEELILRVNRLLIDIPRIREIDINPLIYDTKRKSYMAVDLRVRLR